MAQFEIASGIDGGCIRQLFSDCTELGTDLHTFLIERDGKLLVRASKAPYDCTDMREVYSVTKSFTSVAVGILIDAGKLSLDTRLCDVFPQQVPKNADSRALAVRVRDLLSMQGGQPQCTMAQVEYAEHPVACFLGQPFDRKPGEYFVYNTACSCMLGEIVREISGMPLFDFMARHIFAPLGIQNVRMNTTRSGAAEAGAGLQICADDLLKFGEMLLGGGVYRGKRIVSQKYVEEATAFHADTAGRWGNADSEAGYCYHFWRNSVGGYRLDGSDGQFVLMFPQEKTIVVIQSYSTDVQALLDRVYALLPQLDRAKGQGPIPSEPLLPHMPLQLWDGFYALDENLFGFTQLWLHTDDEAVHLTLTNGSGAQTLSAGRGKFLQSAITAPYYRPKLCPILRQDTVERTVTAACCAAAADGTELFLYHKSCPHPARLLLQQSGDVILITMQSNGRHDPAACRITGRCVQRSFS